MTAPGTTQQAEHLWVTAHEHVRRGDFAAATRDLSGCFQILQALKDPRVTEVHKRWTEVHKLYVEDGARAAPPPPPGTAPPPPPPHASRPKPRPPPTPATSSRPSCSTSARCRSSRKMSWSPSA